MEKVESGKSGEWREKGARGTQSRASSRLAAIESPLSFCRPRPARRRVWNDRDGSFTLSFQHVKGFSSEGTLAASFSLICWFGCRGLASARVRFSPGVRFIIFMRFISLMVLIRGRADSLSVGLFWGEVVEGGW